MVFRVATTWPNPAASQRGFPAPGAGAQTTGPGGSAIAAPAYREPVSPVRPTAGRRSFFKPAQGGDAQRGFPTPQSPDMAYPAGLMDNRPIQQGSPVPVTTPYYDRGAAAVVQNFGKLLYDPIGAGIPVPYRTQASYGPAAQYANSALWWTSQVIPTTINLQGLTDPEALNEILGSTLVQAVVRTTG